MLDLMYDLPSLKNVKECLITEDTISGAGKPILFFENEKGVKSA